MRRFAFALLVSILVVVPSAAHATYLSSASEAANNAGVSVTSDATTIVGDAIAAVLGVLGVVFLILTIYAGLLWMTAGGSTENVKKAKSILLNSVIGLIIVLSSYAITATVVRYLSSNAN